MVRVTLPLVESIDVAISIAFASAASPAVTCMLPGILTAPVNTAVSHRVIVNPVSWVIPPAPKDTSASPPSMVKARKPFKVPKVIVLVSALPLASMVTSATRVVVVAPSKVIGPSTVMSPSSWRAVVFTSNEVGSAPTPIV